MKITDFKPLPPPGMNRPLPKPATSGAPGFGESLKTAVNKVNELQNTAHQSMEALATGATQNIHETMIAIEQAEISFKFMAQVKNKIMTAYQEIMRMQV